MQTRPDVGWFEFLTDNHIVSGGRAKAEAFAIREHYPVSLHCVNMSIGSTDPINWEYLSKVKSFSEELLPWCISDHLCWTSIHGQYSHELLPLPYTDETVMHVADRIRQIQDFLERPIAIENVSTYLNFKHATLTEAQFISNIVNESDCELLFDVNNLFVSHHNTGENIEDYLQTIPWNKVKEMHLAGFDRKENGKLNYLLDTHGSAVSDGVWDLYKQVLCYAPNVPTLIEWDNNIPEWHVLYAEMQKIISLQQNNISL
jgi:uncharacterized protein (UPF0276 family)